MFRARLTFTTASSSIARGAVGPGVRQTGRVLYFAYGSNVDSAQLRGWCPEARVMCASARLDGYELDFRRLSRRWQAGVADIVPRTDANVFGCVWELPDAELAALDRKEGVWIGAYRRLTVSLATNYGDVEAFAYTVVKKSPAAIAPASAYAQLILDAARELRLPLGYQTQVKALLHRLGVVV